MLSIGRKSILIKKDRLHLWRSLFCLLLGGVIFWNLGKVIWENKGRYTSSYWKRYPSYKNAYLGSQYVVEKPAGWIPDEVVYAYAAGEYLKGESPILLDPSQPPLGKYILSASVYLFDNENIAILIFGLGFLIGLFLLANAILKDFVSALLPIFFLSFEKVFLDQFIYVPLLDIIQLTFLIWAFYFFLKANKQKVIRGSLFFFILSSISLGGMISVKFFITGVVVVLSWYLFLLFRKDLKKAIFLSISLPSSLIVLVLSYIKIFLNGYTLRNVFGIQKWIFLYHSSKLTHVFTVWPLIFLNRWYVWWGDKPVLKEVSWQITWPLVTAITFLIIVLYLLKILSKKREVEPIMLWVICYSLFISFGQANARYLIPLLPFLYLISFYGIGEVMKEYIKKR